MDFDDLREYVLGDDVKDIDWKATARPGRPLIKRYVATRQHAVLLVVDTGRTMAALADATSSKRDVAVHRRRGVRPARHRHGDAVGLVAGPIAGLGGRSAHVRNADRIVLRPASARATSTSSGCSGSSTTDRPRRDPSQLDVLLGVRVEALPAADVPRRHHRRHRPRPSGDQALLRRLDAQHEILHCTVGDVDDDRARTRSIVSSGSSDRGGTFPRSSAIAARLHDDLTALGIRRSAATRSTLTRLGIVGTRLSGESDVVPALVRAARPPAARPRGQGSKRAGELIGTDAPPSTFVPADDDIFGPAGVRRLVVRPRSRRDDPRSRAGWSGVSIAARWSAFGNGDPPTCPRSRRCTCRGSTSWNASSSPTSSTSGNCITELSRTVREFAADLGEPGAVAMTASVLEEAGLTRVATVVAGYEQPQFKEWHRSDPWPTSCERAKAVIAEAVVEGQAGRHDADHPVAAVGRADQPWWRRRPSPCSWSERWRARRPSHHGDDDAPIANVSTPRRPPCSAGCAAATTRWSGSSSPSLSLVGLAAVGLTMRPLGEHRDDRERRSTATSCCASTCRAR